MLVDLVTFAEKEFYIAESKAPIELQEFQKHILRSISTPNADGVLPYQTIIYSAPKKSGKTATAALFALWFAMTQDDNNEIYIVANDYEQAQGRVFKAITQAIRLNPRLSQIAEAQSSTIRFPGTGTTITALSSDYASAAGSNHGLTVWDELWAYSSEGSRRLYDELTPVPTRKNSLRFISTYAGWQGESALLWELYQRGLQGTQLTDDPPTYASGKFFMYWDHQNRMPWQTAEYLESQRADLRPVTFLRLHQNEWTTNESAFITPEQWQACLDPRVRRWSDTDKRRLILGADASTSRDLTALVGVVWNEGRTEAVYTKVWKPQRGLFRQGKPTIDLDATIGAEVLRLHALGRVAAVVYDPFQLHAVAINRERAGIKTIEMPQTAQRVESDQALYDAILAKTLVHCGDPTLTEHIQNAVAVETPRGFRLAKEKTSKKIDAAVALSMAAHAAGERGNQTGETFSMPWYGGGVWGSVTPKRRFPADNVRRGGPLNS